MLLQARVLSDVIPGAVGLAYIFSNTQSNESSIFTAVQCLARSGTVRNVGYCSAPDDGHGYPGGAMWREGLLKVGMSSSALVPIKPVGSFESVGSGGAVNTLTETIGLVRHAKARGLEELCIVTAPFHQLRAFITTVSVLKREHPTLRVYNSIGAPLRWNKVVVHSQGVVNGTRMELFLGELNRIRAYHEKGDLVSFDEVTGYLDWRDSATHD